MYALSPVIERAISDLLSDYVGAPAKRGERELADQYHGRPDMVIDVGRHAFLIEYKTRGDAASVGSAIRVLNSHVAAIPKRFQRGLNLVPLVVVPSMGRVGREACEEAAMSWLDLAGNARIDVPGLRVLVDGRKDRRIRSRLPRFNPFARKASRIPRMLLLDPGRSWTQAELAAETALDKGLVSNVVRQLERDGQVTRSPEDGEVRLVDPQLLLDAWREVYDFHKHHIDYGTVAARSGSELLRSLTEQLTATRIRFSATGLAGASLLAPFAEFRTVTLYVDDLPDEETRAKLGYREGRRGSNVWLVLPNDAGVFDGEVRIDGIPCVSAVQCYLDLAAHAERASDAARELRAEHLAWPPPTGRTTERVTSSRG